MKVVPLREAVAVNPKLDRSGLTDDLQVSFVPMAAVGAADGCMDVSTLRTYVEVKKGYTHFRNGDVLFAKVTPCMENGKMAVARNLQNGVGFGSTEFHVLRPGDSVDAQYLYHFVSSQTFRKEAARHMTGAVGLRRVPTAFLESAEIPLPPLARQREIVAEIEKQFSRLDEAVANLQRVKANLKRYKASVLKAAVEGRLVETEASLAHREGRTYETGKQLLQRILVERRAKWNGKGKYKEPSYTKIENSSDLPPGWAYALIDQLAYVDVGFAFKSAEFSSEGLRLLRGENIEPGRLRWTETRYWPESRLAEFRNLLLEEGEIILAMDRPLISSGLKLARVRASDLPCLLVQRVARLRCVDKGMESYLHSCMSTQVFERHLLDGQTGTQLPHVSGTSIGAFVVPVPPASEQIRVAAEVDRHLSIIREVEAEVDANLQRAQALRQATLSSCFQNKGG